MRTVYIKLAMFVLLLLLIMGLLFVWYGGLTGVDLSPSLLVTRLSMLADGAHRGWMLAFLVIASVVAIPLAVIFIAASILFGAWAGFVYALFAASLGASLSFSIGSYLGHDALCRIAGKRVVAISQKLAEHGILSVFIIRLMPIAPFAVVNMVAGATHIRFVSFFLGTTLGMIPGGVFLVLIGDGLVQLLSESAWGWLMVILAAAALIGTGLTLFNWRLRRGRHQ